MKFYQLLTGLPARPLVPGPPAMPTAELVARCLEELDERQREAAQAVVDLHDPAHVLDEDPGRHRARFEETRARAVDARSNLLQQWLEDEQALCEAIAASRATSRGRPWPAPAPDVAHAAAGLGRPLAEANAAADPLARARALDTGRLQRLEQLTGIDMFDADAVHARVVAALVVDRWSPVDEGEALEEVWR